jgi:hypothetical protein
MTGSSQPTLVARIGIATPQMTNATSPDVAIMRPDVGNDRAAPPVPRQNRSMGATADPLTGE